MAPRDPADLYKDKIEVSLDGRQIFYLFFGGAVIVGLVFVLGVMVGRRVEARGHVDQARTASATDPLAALDRLEGSGALSFQGALTGTKTPTDVERAIGERAEADKARKPDAPKAPKSDDKKPEADKKPPEKAKPEAKKQTEPKPEREAKAEAKPEKKAKPDDGDAKKPAKAKKPDGEAAQADEPPRAKFTLQLSSFQDKHEAEAFLSAMRSAGFQPYVMEAEVSGKGTFYRVRLGSFRSLEAANDAKTEFEKTSKKSASVMRL